MEGPLKQKSPRTLLGKHLWDTKYFRLDDDVLYCYGSKKDFKKRNNGKKFPRADITVTLGKNSLTRFEIVVHTQPKVTLSINAASLEERDKWVTALEGPFRVETPRHLSLFDVIRRDTTSVPSLDLAAPDVNMVQIPWFHHVYGKYIPRTVRQRFVHDLAPLEHPEMEQFLGAVAFIDISGFTKLSETLVKQHGKLKGAEELNKQISSYFERMIATVVKYGGDIIKFAGDAMLVLFRQDKSQTGPHASVEWAEDEVLALLLLRCVACTLLLFEEMGDNHLQLKLHMGVAAGTVTGLFVGGVEDRWEFYIAGDPVDHMAEAGDLSEPGECVVAGGSYQLIANFASGTKKAKGHYVINKLVTEVPPPNVREILCTQDMSTALRMFVPMIVERHFEDPQKATPLTSEFRQVFILFVKLNHVDYNDQDMLPSLQAMVCAIQESVNKYKGIISRLLADDKGTRFKIAFGMPTLSYEDDAARAVLAALDIQRKLKCLNTKCSIGIAGGLVLCCTPGSEVRCEYTPVGNKVIMAARLMQAASNGSGILCDEDTYRRSTFLSSAIFKFDIKEPVRMKGFHDPVPVFKPSYCDPRDNVCQIAFVTTEKTRIASPHLITHNSHSATDKHKPKEAAPELLGRQREQNFLRQAVISLRSTSAKVARPSITPSSPSNLGSPVKVAPMSSDTTNRIIVIEGDPGFGKTALCLDLISTVNGWADENVPPYGRVLYCTGSNDIGQGIDGKVGVTHPFRSFFEQLFGIEDTRNKLSRTKIVNNLFFKAAGNTPEDECFEWSEERGAVLNQFLLTNFDEKDKTLGMNNEARAQSMKELLMIALHHFQLCSEVKGKRNNSFVPSFCVMIVEDLHCFNPDAWTFFNWIIDFQQAHANQFTLICTLRPGSLDSPGLSEYMKLRRFKPRYLQLNLLNDADTRTLVGKRLGNTLRPPECLVNLFIERTQGHPFYIQELAQSLIENNVVKVGKKTCEVDVTDLEKRRRRGDDVFLPDSVRTLFAGMINQLPLDLQLTIKILAVIGVDIPANLVSLVHLASTNKHKTWLALMELSKRRFLVRVGAGSPGCRPQPLSEEDYEHAPYVPSAPTLTSADSTRESFSAGDEFRGSLSYPVTGGSLHGMHGSTGSMHGLHGSMGNVNNLVLTLRSDSKSSPGGARFKTRERDTDDDADYDFMGEDTYTLNYRPSEIGRASEQSPGGAPPTEVWFTFRQAFYRDVAYSMLSVDLRRIIHSEIAEYYSRRVQPTHMSVSSLLSSLNGSSFAASVSGPATTVSGSSLGAIANMPKSAREHGIYDSVLAYHNFKCHSWKGAKSASQFYRLRGIAALQARQDDKVLQYWGRIHEAMTQAQLDGDGSTDAPQEPITCPCGDTKHAKRVTGVKKPPFVLDTREPLILLLEAHVQMGWVYAERGFKCEREELGFSEVNAAITELECASDMMGHGLSEMKANGDEYIKKEISRLLNPWPSSNQRPCNEWMKLSMQLLETLAMCYHRERPAGWFAKTSMIKIVACSCKQLQLAMRYGAPLPLQALAWSGLAYQCMVLAWMELIPKTRERAAQLIAEIGQDEAALVAYSLPSTESASYMLVQPPPEQVSKLEEDRLTHVRYCLGRGEPSKVMSVSESVGNRQHTTEGGTDGNAPESDQGRPETPQRASRKPQVAMDLAPLPIEGERGSLTSESGGVYRSRSDPREEDGFPADRSSLSAGCPSIVQGRASQVILVNGTRSHRSSTDSAGSSTSVPNASVFVGPGLPSSINLSRSSSNTQSSDASSPSPEPGEVGTLEVPRTRSALPRSVPPVPGPNGGWSPRRGRSWNMKSPVRVETIPETGPIAASGTSPVSVSSSISVPVHTSDSKAVVTTVMNTGSSASASLSAGTMTTTVASTVPMKIIVSLPSPPLSSGNLSSTTSTSPGSPVTQTEPGSIQTVLGDLSSSPVQHADLLSTNSVDVSQRRPLLDTSVLARESPPLSGDSPMSGRSLRGGNRRKRSNSFRGPQRGDSSRSLQRGDSARSLQCGDSARNLQRGDSARSVQRGDSMRGKRPKLKGDVRKCAPDSPVKITKITRAKLQLVVSMVVVILASTWLIKPNMVSGFCVPFVALCLLAIIVLEQLKSYKKQRSQTPRI